MSELVRAHTGRARDLFRLMCRKYMQQARTVVQTQEELLQAFCWAVAQLVVVVQQAVVHQSVTCEQ